MRVRMWGVHADEPHCNALAFGDLVLVYLGAPEREFIGRAELASAVHEWTPSETKVYPGDSPSGVLLAQVEAWNPPVPMNTVLSRIEWASCGSPLANMRPHSPSQPKVCPPMAPVDDTKSRPRRAL
jgi:hypothetical protein